ncbi:MAG: helix-turn-helix transcriptional regulator [Lachnospiraceae bacterium]|nr:helix-turn-helix transcriptional regulator [Lachnospiraceae bacterium]
MFKHIRDLREDNDFKQSDIASRLGINQPQYQLYESGKRQIPVDILIQLSQIYNVSVDYLLDLTNSRNAVIPTVNPNARKALTYFNRLSEENQDIILGEMVKLHREQEEKTHKKKDIG